MQNQKDIIHCFENGLSGPQYPESVRSFAITLNFYSPRAYEYVRQKFDNHLPCQSTIRNWYSNSSADGEPGFCKQSFVTLTKLAEEQRSNGKQLIVSLIFDEMSIRKQLHWNDSQKKFLGHVTYGFDSDSAELQLANNALVFMVNGINISFNMPIAFYFITSLNGKEKFRLVKEIIEAITACDVRVMNLTFDGLGSNVTMCNSFGANFQKNDFRPYFTLPKDKRKIYIIFDPSHMIKLARNCIANNKVLIDIDGRIRWTYFVRLEKFRELGLSHTHKLNKTHIEYTRSKMNVRIAVQTLSNSVADSMQYLKEHSFEGFVKCSPTIKYIRCLNEIFDIMNTKNASSDNIFKNAISPLNEKEIFASFDDAIRYLQQLRLPDGKLVIYSKTRTAFKGTDFFFPIYIHALVDYYIYISIFIFFYPKVL